MNNPSQLGWQRWCINGQPVAEPSGVITWYEHPPHAGPSHLYHGGDLVLIVSADGEWVLQDAKGRLDGGSGGPPSLSMARTTRDRADDAADR